MHPLQTITLGQQRHLELLAEAESYRRNHPGSRRSRTRPGRLARLVRGERRHGRPLSVAH